jgi:hypothetical protein
MCADRRLETQTTGAEIGMKMEVLGANWWGLLAGDVSRAQRLLVGYREVLSPPFPRNISGTSELLKLLQGPPRRMRAQLLDEHVYGRFAVTYEDFLARGKDQFPEEIFRSSIYEVAQITLECELIVCGFDKEQNARLFHVDSLGNVSEHQHFLAIGTGSSNALAMLYHRQQYEFFPKERTIYHVYEAKKFGELAPGVGRQTEVFALSAEEFLVVVRPGFEELDRLYSIHGPQNTETLADYRFKPNHAFFQKNAPTASAAASPNEH